LVMALAEARWVMANPPIAEKPGAMLLRPGAIAQSYTISSVAWIT